jgi:hypothetical protein
MSIICRVCDKWFGFGTNHAYVCEECKKEGEIPGETYPQRRDRHLEEMKKKVLLQEQARQKLTREEREAIGL